MEIADAAERNLQVRKNVALLLSVIPGKNLWFMRGKNKFAFSEEVAVAVQKSADRPLNATTGGGKFDLFLEADKLVLSDAAAVLKDVVRTNADPEAPVATEEGTEEGR